MSDDSLSFRQDAKIRFNNSDQDYLFTFMLGRQSYNGAELGECFEAASRIKDGDYQSWKKELTEMAQRVESRARTCELNNHKVSARESYLRASNYYRFSVLDVDETDLIEE